MNWQAMDFDWNQVRAFLATAEEGSFSGAARALKTTQPTIGRQISSLEDALGVTLVERSVKGLTLTAAGRSLLGHVQAMGEAASLISMSAAGQSQEVEGEVTITATDLMSAEQLPDLLMPLRETAPGLRLRIVATSDIQNIMKREADISIRHARPDQPELIARHVGTVHANLYAATDYLDRAGRPQTAREVADHAFVGNADPDLLLAPLHAQGIPLQRENFRTSTESGVVAWALTKAGYGISMQPDILGDRTPGIEKVFPDLVSPEVPVWLVTHRELNTSRKIRLVFDHIAESLAEIARTAGR